MSVLHYDTSIPACGNGNTGIPACEINIDKNRVIINTGYAG
jgi:hypothetical protein